MIPTPATARRSSEIWLLLGIAIGAILLLLGALQILASGDSKLLVLIFSPWGALAIYLRPRFATYLCAFLIYSNIPVVAAQFHGAPYIAAAATPGLLLIPIAYFLFVRKEGIIFSTESIFVVAVVLVEALGVIFSRDPNEAFFNLARGLCEGLGLFLLITNAVRTPEGLRGSLWALVIAGGLMGLVTGHQYATGAYHSNYGGMAQADQIGFDEVNERGVQVMRARSAGSVGEKNRFAQNMLMLLPVVVFLAVSEKAWPLQTVAWCFAGLIVIGWAVAFSRGSIVGLGGTIIVGVLLGYVRPRTLFLLGIAGLLFVMMMPSYRERITSLLSVARLAGSSDASAEMDGSLRGRATIMLAAGRVMAENPIVGVGPGMFPYYAREYGQAGGMRALQGNWEAHNLYLGIGADRGLLGLGFFLAGVGTVMFKLHHHRTRLLTIDPSASNLAMALNLVLLIYLTTGMFLHFSYVRYFWLLLGISSAACYVLKTSLPEATQKNSE